MRKIALLCLLLGAMSMQAFTVIVCTTSGEQSLSSENVGVMWFTEDGSLVYTSNDGTDSAAIVPADEFKSLKFPAMAVGAAQVVTDLPYAINGTILSCGSSDICVFNPAGLCVASGFSGSVDLAGLDPGLYIVKTPSQSFSIYIK